MADINDMDPIYREIYDKCPKGRWFTVDEIGNICACKLKSLVGVGLLQGDVRKMGNGTRGYQNIYFKEV